jgi:leucyl aminopeptidase
MYRALAALAIVVGCARPAPTEVGDRYLTIDRDAIATARAVTHGKLHVIDSDGEIALLTVPAQDLDALSEQMHEQHHRCGGFVIYDSLDDAELSLHAAVHDGGDRIDYTLDHAGVVNAMLPDVDAARILDTIRQLSAMKNRYYRSESGAAASLWLRDKWRSFTTRTDVTVELFDQGYEQKSVILTIPGTTRKNEIVVVGGHLDSIAIGGTSSNAPGADDDASGIATLTEVARVLLAKDFHPARTIKFMAYAAEEVGLRGSQAIVRDFKKRNVIDNVVGALQLDMTNYRGSDRDIWLMSDFTSAAQNTFLSRLIEAYVGATWGVDKCGYACSDHASWNRAGVPASMPFESRMRDGNNKIHSARDTLEVSDNNAAHAVKFARLGTAYAIELAKGELGDGPPASPTHRTPWLALLAGLVVVGAGLRFVTRAA